MIGIYAYCMAICTTIVQDVGIHTGVSGNIFSLTLATINMYPVVNDSGFNYSMDLALLGVPHTIEWICASIGCMVPTYWSIGYM